MTIAPSAASFDSLERRSYLSSPIERPDRKIIQKRIVIQNHQNYQICQLGKEIFYLRGVKGGREFSWGGGSPARATPLTASQPIF